MIELVIIESWWWSQVNDLPLLTESELKFGLTHAPDLTYFIIDESTGYPHNSHDKELTELVQEFTQQWETAYYLNYAVTSTWFSRNIMWPLWYSSKIRNKMRRTLDDIYFRRHIVHLKLVNLHK